jgi:phosphoserine phosphatase RsbU/P
MDQANTMSGGSPSGSAKVTPPLTLDAVSGPPLPSIHAKPEKPIVLGRSGQSDVVLGDESISRRHCQLSARQGTWFIEDLGSRHGTFVQSAKLAEGQSLPLKNGDMVGVGPWLLRVRIGTGAVSTAGSQRLVTLMSGGSTVNTTGAGGSSSAAMRERVERVNERELAALNQNRLKLLIDVAAAVAGSSDEEALAKTIVRAAAEGTGFPRAFLFRDETIGQGGEDQPGGEAAAADTLRVIYEIDPDAERRNVPDSGITAAASFSRSLIAAARKGEVVRLTSDAPMQAQSIMALGIQTALCAPISIGPAVAGFLYLDSRSGEKQGPRTGGVIAPVGGSGGVHSDAAAFCSALAKMYSLAVGNISRLELERRQRELVRDLEAASEAQQLIMPPPHGQMGRVRYAMRSKSGRYVAGDLFDVVDVGDGRVAMLLGDVAGKGVPAAILMATAQTHLHVALRAGKTPAEAVREVNNHICTHMASNKFISLWLGVLDPAAGTLTYVDAGHGYWLLTRPGQSPSRTDCATGIPLGIDPTFEFDATTIPIAPGQRLIVFSDGVVEQPSPEGPMFGIEGAIRALEGSAAEREDVERIFEAVLAHARGPNLADDTTVASVVIE